MNANTIDVVILSLNRARMTLEAVRSVQFQQDVVARIYVLDQGSDTYQAASLQQELKPREHVHFLMLGKNLGVAEGRNRGIALGISPVVVCLDNDAELRDPRSLRHVLARFDADSTLGALGFSIIDWTTRQIDRRSWVYPRAQLKDWKKGFKTTRFCGAGHALRRQAFERAGGYDPSLFFYWEELDLSNRLIELGYGIEYDPEVIILHKGAEEGQFRWQDKRFYYLVRNALYLDWKFYRSPFRLALMAAGYFTKGIYNGVLIQGMHGISDVFPRIRNLPQGTARLGPAAREYIKKYEIRYRGSIWMRLRREVFEKFKG
jgi:GT2 family glycosyltransferase